MLIIVRREWRFCLNIYLTAIRDSNFTACTPLVYARENIVYYMSVRYGDDPVTLQSDILIVGNDYHSLVEVSVGITEKLHNFSGILAVQVSGRLVSRGK